MKIINGTNYRVSDLRQLLIRMFEAEGVSHKDYHITVKNRRKGFVAGYGYYNSKDFCLKLPKPEKYEESVAQKIQDGTDPIWHFTERVAQVAVHELGHTLNLRHKEMIRYWDIDVSWARGLVIREKQEKGKEKKNLKEQRRDRALGMLEKHEGKLKREQKLVKKWKAKVRYYEKAFEKAASKEE